MDISREIIESVSKYCLEKVEPFAAEDDHNEFFRSESYQGLGELGLTGLTLPEIYGGAELNYTLLSQTLEEISKYSVSLAVTLSVSTMVQNMINHFGSDDQKSRFLPKLTSGEGIGAFCLSEAGSGSDAASLKTTAKKTDEGYILNGTKMWITSGGIASTYLVMARTSDDGAKGISAFLVENGTPGLTFGKKEEKMGWKASPTREVVFENCLIPHHNLLGDEGIGFKVAMKALDSGRITIGAIGVGLAQRALDEAGKYSLIRKQFGKSIFDFQGLQFLMSDMALDLESARLLVYEAAKRLDSGKDFQKYACMAKIKATDTAMRVTTDAVQVMGGVGYTREYPLERMMRDAKVLQIVEGTNQIQKIVIARNLKKEWA